MLFPRSYVYVFHPIHDLTEGSRTTVDFIWRRECAKLHSPQCEILLDQFFPIDQRWHVWSAPPPFVHCDGLALASYAARRRPSAPESFDSRVGRRGAAWVAHKRASRRFLRGSARARVRDGCVSAAWCGTATHNSGSPRQDRHVLEGVVLQRPVGLPRRGQARLAADRRELGPLSARRGRGRAGSWRVRAAESQTARDERFRRGRGVVPAAGVKGG